MISTLMDVPDCSALSLDREGPVATVHLNRPEARNAMGPAFFDELPTVMETVADAEAVRVVVLAAHGPVFCAGIDLKAMVPAILPEGEGSTVAERRELLQRIRSMQDAISAVEACPVPVIAAVHGPCIGGGVDLITACDVRLASADATFSVRETKLAMVADLGTLQRIQQIVPQGHVAELVYTGKDIPADRAARIGLVNDVHSTRDALRDAAKGMAREIAANAPLAVQGAKRMLQRSRDRTVEEGLEDVAVWNAAFLQSDDLREALHAYREGRPPEFEGQ